jgi:hypothetical protein
MMKISPRYFLARELAWAVTLGTGFGSVWFVMVIWLGTLDREDRRNWPPRENLVVRSDGTPLIQVTTWKDYSISYRDLSGAKQADLETADRVPAVRVTGVHETPGAFPGNPSWQRRLRLFFNDRAPTVNWFFVHDGKTDGAGYFVGYERESNRRVGFIGLAGLRHDPVPVTERIPVRGALTADFVQWSSAPLWINLGRQTTFSLARSDLPPRLVYVPSGNSVREVDLAAGTVTTILDASEPIESTGIPTLESWSGGHYAKEPPILVRTRQQIYALDRSHKTTRQFTIPDEVDLAGPVSWYDLGDGQAIAQFIRAAPPAEYNGTIDQLIYRIGPDGAIQERYALTLQTGPPAKSMAGAQTLLLLGVPAPALLLVVEPLAPFTSDPLQSYARRVVAAALMQWRGLTAVAGFSLLLAILAWRRCRSFGLPKRERVAWLIFVLLLGLPAFVGFLLGRRWPVRESCTTCHALAPRDRDDCANCGTRFPEPPLRGIEVFA